MPPEEEGGVTPDDGVTPPDEITDFGQGGGGDAIITIDPPIIIPPSDFSLSGQATVTLPVFATISLSGRAITSVTPAQIRSVSLSGFVTSTLQLRFVQSVTLSDRATVGTLPVINFALALNGKANITTDPIVGGVVEVSIALSASATVDLEVGYAVCECPDYLFDPIDNLAPASFRSGVFIPIFRLTAGSVYIPATPSQTWLRSNSTSCHTYGPVGFQYTLGPLMLRYATATSGTTHDGTLPNPWKRKVCG